MFLLKFNCKSVQKSGKHQTVNILNHLIALFFNKSSFIITIRQNKNKTAIYSQNLEKLRLKPANHLRMPHSKTIILLHTRLLSLESQFN
jgi:hypothetical protein